MVNIFAVRVPAREYYDLKVLGVLQYLLQIGVVVFMLSNLFLEKRFNYYDDGMPYYNVIVVPSRDRPYPNERMPAFCSESSLDMDVTDPRLQSVIGRMCAQNISCNRWFETGDLVEITQNRWFVMTSLLGRPHPISPFRSIKSFDFESLKSGDYLFADPQKKKEMERALWGDNFDFTCQPSYFPLGVENTTLGVVSGFTHSSLGNVLMPRTKIFNIHGKLLEDLRPNHMANLRIGDLFDLNAGGLERVLNLPPLANAPIALAYPLRTLGAKATIEFRFRNFHGTPFDQEITLEIHPKLIEGIPAVHSPKYVPTYEMQGTTPIIEWFKPFGLDIEIKTSAIIGTPNYYPLILHFIALTVMVDKAGSIVTSLIKLGYRYFKRFRIRMTWDGEEIENVKKKMRQEENGDYSIDDQVVSFEDDDDDVRITAAELKEKYLERRASSMAMAKRRKSSLAASAEQDGAKYAERRIKSKSSMGASRSALNEQELSVEDMIPMEESVLQAEGNSFSPTECSPGGASLENKALMSASDVNVKVV